MSWSKEFIELNKNIHDRLSFDCGEEELNTFIQTKAAKHMDTGISITRVLPSVNLLANGKYQICAFYSLAPSSIEYETLPKSRSKKLPKYSIPVFLIAQLAVHKDYLGQGLGKITLVKALEYLWNVNSQMRAYAVVVDCLNQKAQDFYLKYDFEILCEHNGRIRMFLPMDTINQLFE